MSVIRVLEARSYWRAVRRSALIVWVCIGAACSLAQSVTPRNLTLEWIESPSRKPPEALAGQSRRSVTNQPTKHESSSYGPLGQCLFELDSYTNLFDRAGGAASFSLDGGGAGCVYQPQVTVNWIHLLSYPAQGRGVFSYTVDPNPSNVPRAGGIRLLNTQHMVFQLGAPNAPYTRLYSESPGATLLVGGVATPTPAFVHNPELVRFEAPEIWTVNSGERRLFRMWSDGKARVHEAKFVPDVAYLVARFETQFLLSVTANGPGTVNTTPFYSHGYHPGGATVILKASPSPGSIFSGWSGDLTSSENPAFIGMSMPRKVVANFIPDPNAPTLSVTVPLPLQTGREPESLTTSVTITSSGMPVSIGQPKVSCPVEPPVLQAELDPSNTGVTPVKLNLAIDAGAVPLYPH